MVRPILFLLLLLPLSLSAGDSSGVFFCLDVLPVVIPEGILLAGSETAFSYTGSARDYEQYIGFYTWDGAFKSLGAFEGTFSGAFSAGAMVYILESGNGFSRYKLEDRRIVFKGFQPAGRGRIWITGTIDRDVVYVLAYEEKEKQLQVLAIHPEKEAQPVFPGFGMAVQPRDVRMVFDQDRPVISWRADDIKGIGLVFRTETGWERRDFQRTEVNCYDLAPGPFLYIIGTLDFDQTSRIGVSRWQDMDWTAPEPIPGSEMPFAEKYGRIRVQYGPDGGVLLARTAYVPFGIAGVQVFQRSPDRWHLEIPGLRMMPLLLAAGGLFLAGMALAAAAVRNWFPILMYRRVQSVQVGSLLSRLAAYTVDAAVSALIAVTVTGLLRFQDMHVMAYFYVLYTVFFICLFLYGLLTELLIGSTPGKLIMGLYLYNRIGMRCSLQEILLRNMVKVFEAHMLIVPALTMLFSEQNQRLGDIIAGTRVQKKETYGL